MNSFLIISAISLTLLLIVYHLVLQRERMHVFNRVYLLFSLCFSFVIPFIQIEAAPGNLPLPELKRIVEIAGQTPVAGQTPPPVLKVDMTPFLVFFIYLAGVLTMTFRFARNLLQLRMAMVKNPKLPIASARIVLLDKPVMPHSFFHFIFISRSDYENKAIEEELLQHELTHVRQRHSLDILLIELLQIVFWFNPLLFLYRRAIKLNHEFLADQSVLRSNNDVTTYQEILLNKIFMNKASGLASHVHYSLTKKRLIMMTRNTSFLRALALKMTATLLYIALFLTFCVEALAQNPVTPPKVKEKPHWTTIKNQDSLRRVKYLYYGSMPGVIISFVGRDGVRIKKRYEDMTNEEKEMLPPPPPPPEKKLPTASQLTEWQDASKYGVWIDNKRVSNDVLSNYQPDDFGHYFVSRLLKNATNYGKHTYQLDLMTTAAFENWRQGALEARGLDRKQ